MNNYRSILCLIVFGYSQIIFGASDLLLEKTIHKKQTKKKYYYIDEKTLPENVKHKILIFAYGSLVKQKANKRTGDAIYADSFIKTPIKVPISFTFLAGYPKNGYLLSPAQLEKFTTRRATITIDAYAHEYKNLWFANSDFSFLPNALNNLAAREGAALINERLGYDLSNIFYIKRLRDGCAKTDQEENVPDFSQWVTLRPSFQHQRLTTKTLHAIIKFTEEHEADVALWVALPSNINKNNLKGLLKDPIFVSNTYRYIQSMPPQNTMTYFEKAIIKSYGMLDK